MLAGLIVNVSSASAFWALPWMSHYSASKAALKSLSDSLRVELRPFNVKVMVAAPGFVKTEIYNKSAGRRFLNPDGPYGPIAKDLDVDLIAGLPFDPFPAPSAETFSRRFVRCVLGGHHPSIYLDGKYSWTTYLAGTFVPSWVLDLIAYVQFSATKLAPWYPWRAVSNDDSKVTGERGKGNNSSQEPYGEGMDKDKQQ